jgi:hypothetical protein
MFGSGVRVKNGDKSSGVLRRDGSGECYNREESPIFEHRKRDTLNAHSHFQRQF